jgi:cyclic beta-1,2-glucan synthetase
VQGRAEYRRRDQASKRTRRSRLARGRRRVRRVTLTNLSRTRRIEVTSYAEVVLAPLNADLAHPPFSNLFVQTEILPERQAIVCTRRRRTPGEAVPWMFHLLAAPGARADAPSYETDRARFIGRGRSTANPLALDSRDGRPALSNTDGSVLDPVVAIRRNLTLAPDESASVQIISGVVDTRETALALLEKYCDRHFVERAFEMAWFQSQEVLRHLNADEADAQIFGRLANSVVYGNALRRAAPAIIARNRLGQSGLWRFGISGDLPIVLLHIGDLSRIDLVRQTLQAHAYWRIKGLAADLVIVNEDFSGYRAVLQDRILGLIQAGPEAQVVDKPGGVFVRRAEELSEDERTLLQTVARIVFSDTAETPIEQVDRRVSAKRAQDLLEPVRRAATEAVHPLEVRERIFSNGLGGFTPDAREYVVTLEPGQTTPAPWVNVIASPHIGTVVSESGSTYTWVENAHEFRLTTWHNDPLSDASGEALYIRDEETGTFWSPTPLPARGRSGYVCRHGFGYSVFEHYEAGIASELHTYVAMDAPVKILAVKLRNASSRTRTVSLTGYWELVLGEWRHSNLMHIVTETDPETGALLARNAYGREFANRVVFAHVSERKPRVSGSRTEFIGRNGSLASPEVMRRRRLSGRTGPGLDPCAALQTQIELAAGQEHEVVFVFGAAGNADEARHFIQRFGGRAGARQALESVWEHWNRTLGAVNVDTPDAALNVLANGWLVYQTISCRLWGRSGYYQSGGAYGFRDQLQDTMALIHATPWLAREQLLRCAGRQFQQGDVQHWWHPPNGQGVRTRFSDDYLWLPYAACRYVAATGDTGVLDESIPFLEGRELHANEEAYYDQPQTSSEAASLYEHCVRAIRHGLRFGVHHLPLMGCGDWNDGMNLVGKEGKGESVWLGWFLFENLESFADLARRRGDMDFAEVCSAQAVQLRSNIEEQAWDGAWYRRAWFDDGTPLGSAGNDECQIDSISQSWAVLSRGGDPLRARQAMSAVDTRLVRRDKRIIQLLDPPFDKSDLEPGYIKGYIPGVRENGGQYTHAAIWTTMAFAMLGDTDRAWEFFAMLNPINHGSTREAIERYRVEPYVMSADIYDASPHTGRGGWTWYTGAAGWMYRLTVETLLGLHLEVDHLRIAPCVPANWESYSIHYRYRETVYHIVFRRVGVPSGQAPRLTVDGVERPDARIPLVDDRREHHVDRQEVADGREGGDMLAQGAEGHEQRRGDQHTYHRPEPRPQRHRNEHHHGVEPQASPYEVGRDDLAFDGGQAEVDRCGQQRVAGGVEAYKPYGQRDADAGDRPEVGDEVQHRGDHAEQRRVRHAERPHRGPDRDAEPGVDHRDGEEVPRELALNVLRDPHRDALVAEGRQHVHHLFVEHVAGGEQEEQQDQRKEDLRQHHRRVKGEAAEQARPLDADPLDLLLDTRRLRLALRQFLHLLGELAHPLGGAEHVVDFLLQVPGDIRRVVDPLRRGRGQRQKPRRQSGEQAGHDEERGEPRRQPEPHQEAPQRAEDQREQHGEHHRQQERARIGDSVDREDEEDADHGPARAA